MYWIEIVVATIPAPPRITVQDLASAMLFCQRAMREGFTSYVLLPPEDNNLISGRFYPPWAINRIDYGPVIAT